MLGGFQAIGDAGTLAAVKYIMDSWKNSPDGENPVLTLKNAVASVAKPEEKKIRTAPRKGRFLLGEKKEKEEMNEKVKK